MGGLGHHALPVGRAVHGDRQHVDRQPPRRLRRRQRVASNERIDPTTGAAWLNTTAFTTAPDGRLGTSGAASSSARACQWDISLRKQFRIKGDVKVAFQADFFNVWNHVNWGNPNTDLTRPASA